MSEKKLQKLMRKWKKILGLDGWDIIIYFARQNEFFDKNTPLGEINYTSESGEAIIKILDPVDWYDIPFAHDIEKVVVHELLHLHFSPFEPKGEIKHQLWENTIERMAKTLVRFRRKKMKIHGGKQVL